MNTLNRKKLMIFWLLALVLIGIPAIVFVTGQLGGLRGSPPAALGVGADGQLAPPSPTPNSVSSQTDRHPGHPQAAYAAIAPFSWQSPGTGQATLERLERLLQDTPGVTVVQRAPGYLRAEAETRWLRFVDDLEFVLDEPAGVIHVRASSRLGRKDFGVNRTRIEHLRQRLGTP
jgi:uncharacterized protein (DUF1499 family)